MLVYAKAYVGAIITGLSTLATAIQDNHVTGYEWVTVAIATLGAFGGVAATSNKTKQDNSVTPTDTKS